MLALLISGLLGTIVVLSTQANLVNGVTVRQDAWPLPFPLAVTLVVLSGFGPSLAAIAVSAWERRLTGVRTLLHQLVEWRANPIWYATALVLPVVLSVLSTLMWAALHGGLNGPWLRLAPVFQLLGLPIGPWGEEIGWRGFAQPRLQARLAWPAASVWVGLMWFGWHQWPLLTPAAQPLDVMGLGVFFIYIVSASVVIGWIYNRGARKLPLGWAGHAGLNLAGPSTAPFPFVAGVYAVAALLVATAGWRTESNGREIGCGH